MIDVATERKLAEARVRDLGIGGYASYLRSLTTTTESYQRLRERWLHDDFEQALAAVTCATRRRPSRL